MVCVDTRAKKKTACCVHFLFVSNKFNLSLHISHATERTSTSFAAFCLSLNIKKSFLLTSSDSHADYIMTKTGCYHLMCSIFYSNRNSLETQWPNSTFLFCACGPMMEHLKNLLNYSNFTFLHKKSHLFYKQLCTIFIPIKDGRKFAWRLRTKHTLPFLTLSVRDWHQSFGGQI